MNQEMTATTQPGITLEERFWQEVATKDGEPTELDREILASLLRLKEIEGKLRETYEIYAGMEGIPVPQTACEAYLLRIIDEMQKSIAILLRGKP